jgi:hypothetical protein
MMATRDSCSSGSNSREPVVVPDLPAGAVRIFQVTARLGSLVRVTLLVGLIFAFGRVAILFKFAVATYAVAGVSLSLL